ncbi:MAG TPA: glycosyltransferase family 1 protein [Opitutaceae bacterium]
MFTGRPELWQDVDPGIEICSDFPSNERPLVRLLSDHFCVAPEARRRGAAALVTVGFLPVRSSGMPVVMQVFAAGNQGQVSGLRSLYRQWTMARGLREAALVITNSEWARTALGHTSAPVVVSPEGLRHDVFKTDGATATSDGYFLWVSNFYAYKRAELALRAYAGLAPETRARHPFVLVGGDWRGGRACAEAEAARLGIGDNVRFKGWVGDDELPGLYSGALAHVLSTSSETFGRSLLESMACGCPSVVQDIPVLREVAGDAAVFVDFGDTPAATAALERVGTDGLARSRLVAAGIARAASFSFERLARERVGAILDILEGKKP